MIPPSASTTSWEASRKAAKKRGESGAVGDEGFDRGGNGSNTCSSGNGTYPYSPIRAQTVAGGQRSAAGSRCSPTSSPPRGKSPPPPPPSPPPLLPPPWPPSMRPGGADEEDALFEDVELAVTRAPRLAPVSHAATATMVPTSSVSSVSLVSSLSTMPPTSMASPLRVRGVDGGGEGEEEGSVFSSTCSVTTEQTQPYLVEQLQGYNSYLQGTLTRNIAPQGTLESRQTLGVVRQRESLGEEMTMIARIDALTDRLAQDTHDTLVVGDDASAVFGARHEEGQQQQQQQQQPQENVSAGRAAVRGHTFTTALTQRAEEELSSGWEAKYEKAQRQFVAGRL